MLDWNMQISELIFHIARSCIRGIPGARMALPKGVATPKKRNEKYGERTTGACLM